jgi:glucose-6-phosphate 1-dehydrogenase
MDSKPDFPAFCYNVKNIQMLAPQAGNTVNLAQIDENKTIQYIAQPFTSYGQSYTIVNPLQLAGQNGQIVINKPVS